MGFYAIEDYVCQRYTREQAIAEGLLVDISEVTVNLGFLAPVAMTKMAWSDAVEWSAVTADQKNIKLDEKERLRVVAYSALLAARQSEGMARTLFDLYRIPALGKSLRPRRATMVMQIAAGDHGEPTITISLPGEH